MKKDRFYYTQKYPVYKILNEEIFYDGVTEKQLKAVAKELVEKLREVGQVPLTELTHYAKRYKEPLIKWYQKNWKLIKHLVFSIVPIDEKGNTLKEFDKKKFLWKFKESISIHFSLEKLDDIEYHDDYSDFNNDEDEFNGDDWFQLFL